MPLILLALSYLCFSHKLLILKNGASIILKNRESINGKEKKELNLFIEKLSGESRLSVVGCLFLQKALPFDNKWIMLTTDNMESF